MSSKTDGTIPPRWWWLLLAVTFIAAAALRAIGLGSGLWYDEIVTLVQSARHPVARIVTDFPGVNAHPLYSLLAHASLSAFGESAWALRVPACVFGIASIVMVYILGASLTSRTEAWAGSALLAASYHHVWFSQNARGYTLLGFLTLLSTWLLLRALGRGERPGGRGDYVWYAIVCAAGMYTHLTMTFVIAGHAAAVLLGIAMRWVPARRHTIAPLLWAWVGVGVLSAALYAPFVPGLIAWMGRDAPRAAAKVATAGWAASEALRALFADWGVWASIVTGLLAVAGAWSLLRREPLAAALLIVPGVVTAVAMVATGQPIRPRFFFFLAGGAAIFMGRGLGALAERLGRATATRRQGMQPAVIACTLPLLALSAAGLPRNYQVPKQDFDAAVARMTHEESRGARIVAAGPACLPLDEYYGKTWACIRREDEWNGLTAVAAQQPVLLLYTLLDYVDDPGLQQQLRTTCPVVARFEATLRGGDLVICRPHGAAASADAAAGAATR